MNWAVLVVVVAFPNSVLINLLNYKRYNEIRRMLSNSKVDPPHIPKVTSPEDVICATL